MPEKVNLSSPWAIWVRKLRALFERDDEVSVQYDEEEMRVQVRVSNAIKADALAQIIPTERHFGNVALDVAVVPCNEDATPEQVWRWAFDGNPALAGTEVDALPDGSPITFALFAPECAQYFADDLTNPLGLQTRTYEQLAHDVLDAGDVVVTSDAMGE